VYSSDDAVNWEKQTEKILREPGKIKGDDAKGQHCDVVVSGDRAFIFYFVHQDAGKGRNTHIQVAELEYKDGKITCDRNKDAYVNLIP
ncbi:MAG: hypothetical protein LBR84_04980, partial [Tannerella sp.]|nr:hypothetical protein [Tannerella sp.]